MAFFITARTPASQSEHASRWWKRRDWAFWLAPVLFVFAFSASLLTNKTGISWTVFKDNWNQLFTDGAVPVFLSLGASIVLASGAVDLSTPGVAALTGVIFVIVIRSFDTFSIAIILAALTSFSVATICGLLLSELVSRFRASPLIASWSLGTVWFYISMLASLQAGGTVQSIHSLNLWNSAFWIYLGSGQIIIILTLALFSGIMQATMLPKMAAAVGANERSARYLGLDVGRVRRASFITSANLACFAGIFGITVTGGSANIDTFRGKELVAIAIAVLGGTVMSGGYLRLFSVLSAALFWVTISGTATHFNFHISDDAPEGHELVFALLVLAVAAIVRDGTVGDLIRVYQKR